jgi:type II secretory pathway pseudopilin PulG
LISVCGKKGISMIEVLISMVLISLGVLSLLTLLPSGWRLSGTSDMLGRAAGILQAQLERNEVWIMNEKNPVTPTEGIPSPLPVYSSGKDTPQPGDIQYLVTTQIQDLGGGSGPWRVRVQVTWPGNTTGVSESVIVTRQLFFAQ